jgi:GTPase SAR1 family protein
VVLVYDVTKESSLAALDLWLEELEQHGLGREVPRILVGNKCDEGRQQVSTLAAQRWADDRCTCGFIYPGRTNKGVGA